MSEHSFNLTETQRAFRDMMRAFSDEKIAPNAEAADREAAYPWASFNACKEADLCGLGIPEAYGGQGADMVTQAIMTEEI